MYNTYNAYTAISVPFLFNNISRSHVAFRLYVALFEPLTLNDDE